MTTIKDIAEYAGVSATTVSNVIHGKKKRVSQETIDRIQEAIRELNYVPNMFARSLVSSSSKVIALINHVPTRSDATFSDDTFQMSFLSTIEDILRKQGYYLMFRHVETGEELQQFLQNWNVDGLFLTGICNKEFIDEIPPLNVPTVVIDSTEYFENSSFIGLNDENGGYLATKHIIENGHKRIAYVTSPIHDGYVMKDRFSGYKKALEENGIDFDESIVLVSDVDLESCRQVADKITKLDGVTGIVAATDLMAAGILTRFHELDINVPEDYSIVGFDDAAIARMTVPPLTTIRQDMVEKASTAANFILKMLDGTVTENEKIRLEVKLIERKSVRNIKA